MSPRSRNPGASRLLLLALLAVPVAGLATLAAHLQTGKGLLLDMDTAAPLRDWSRGWKDRIAYVASGAKEELGMRALLVRPDGIVAWAGSGGHDAELEQAGRRWFGGPSVDRD